MEKQKGKILAHSHPAIERLLRHPWVSVSLCGATLLGMAAAFALAPLGQALQVPRQTILEQLNPPTTKLVAEPWGYLREEHIQRSDTVASLVTRLGITTPEALEFIRKDRGTQIIARQLRPGKTVSAKTDGSGDLISLYFPLNGKEAMLVVEKQGDQYAVSEQAISLETQIVVNSGVIRNSLFAATDEKGIPEAIAMQLAEIFGGEIDFYRDLRKGDRFSLVYEALTHRGQAIRSGRILSAEFTNKQKAYSAYWFQTDGGKGGYYSTEGKSLRKAFLRAPLAFSRVTSGFSASRAHPVLQISRAHKGVDYGAPTGTPVLAVADAIIEFAGHQSGYGNMLILKHQGAYSTAYGHLNGFATGARKGSRVSQGDTIGYVGQTGLATGPHLHYEFRVNAQQINPLAATLPDAAPLEASQISRFKDAVIPLRADLELAKQIQFTSTN